MFDSMIICYSRRIYILIILCVRTIMFSKKTILTKTSQISACTMLSRVLGILRDTLTIRYLGAGMLQDAFVTAFKIPNGLRKIFAEGAMSAAFVPSLSASIHAGGRTAANGLMSLSFIVFEGIVLALCVVGVLFAQPIIAFIAPGFAPEAVEISAACLRIVMPFIFFVSSSALFAGALQSVGQFFVPAFSPVLFNIVFIATLLICLYAECSVNVLCWGIVCGGAAQFLLHLIFYLRAHFGFGVITSADKKTFLTVLGRFLLCLPSVSLMELSLFVDTSFASYLKPGTITLINLSNRFVGIPLGVFAVAFATVLLPHFSRVAGYARKRLPFYLLEGAKLVFFVSLPVLILMWYFADNIFETLFLSGTKFTMTHVVEAANILRAFLVGLFFFSFNRVVLNVYYAIHVAWVPALISTIAALVNVLLDWLFLDLLQSVGLALATTMSAMVRTLLLLLILHYCYNQKFHGKQLGIFMVRYSVQAILFFIPFLLLYHSVYFLLALYSTEFLAWFLLHSLGFWFWVGPLSLCYCGALWYFQKIFCGRVYFLP
jgi:putative peptidoglycan lipid II flippase